MKDARFSARILAEPIKSLIYKLSHARSHVHDIIVPELVLHAIGLGCES